MCVHEVLAAPVIIFIFEDMKIKVLILWGSVCVSPLAVPVILLRYDPLSFIMCLFEFEQLAES